GATGRVRRRWAQRNSRFSRVSITWNLQNWGARPNSHCGRRLVSGAVECPGVVPHLPPDVPEMRISLAVAAAPGVAVLYGQGLSPPNLGTSPALRHSHGGTGIESLHYPRFAARVLLIPLRQPGSNDLQVQVSALRQGESP